MEVENKRATVSHKFLFSVGAAIILVVLIFWLLTGSFFWKEILGSRFSVWMYERDVIILQSILIFFTLVVVLFFFYKVVKICASLDRLEMEEVCRQKAYDRKEKWETFMQNLQEKKQKNNRISELEKENGELVEKVKKLEAKVSSLGLENEYRRLSLFLQTMNEKENMDEDLQQKMERSEKTYEILKKLLEEKGDKS